MLLQISLHQKRAFKRMSESCLNGLTKDRAVQVSLTLFIGKSHADVWSLLPPTLQSTTLHMPHSEQRHKDTASHQPILTLERSLLLQKICIHQVASEPREVISFLEAKFTLPAPKTEVIPSSMPISIHYRLDLYGDCFWQHSGLWSFQLCRRDVMEVQR